MKRNALLLALIVATVTAFSAFAENGPAPAASKGKQHQPVQRGLTKFKALDFADAAKAEAKNPPREHDEVEEIVAPQPPPDIRKGLPLPGGLGKLQTHAAPASATGPSPVPFKTFKGEFVTSLNVPPDTMGAVGTTHILTVTNDRIRIQTRDGIEVSRMTLNAFWAGTTIKGNAVTSTFDPKVLFDRFNNRFIMVSSAGAQSINSGALFAVSATADPTGAWYRWTMPSDPASTAGGGHWIDYPSIAHNKNWIVVDENTFNYGSAGTGYWGQQIFVLDKQAAYANTLGSISVFEANFSSVCLASATPESELACGFTMAPSLVEDNTTDTVYLVEDWDNIAGQLRLSKITGTPAAPVLTVGTQFPQSLHSWVFNAARIVTPPATNSAGYMPQRQIAAYLPSGTRIAANDSRIQNAVLRNGTLWTTHTVMLAATPTAAGAGFGTGNPDTHSGVQWWQIDPTVETGLPQLPLQRARIEDPSADNCHNGAGNTNTVGPRCTSPATQTGEFFAFPNISVNSNNDVLLGFTRVSPLTNGSSGYALRRAADPANTFRDPVIFRPGQANYNIVGGSPQTTRWGDYSASQTDPLNDTDFWTIQEYAGVQRDAGIGLAGVWETWWSQIRPSGTIPSTTGNLLITEMRLRGSASTRDEYIEIYNPNPTPVIVNVADNSDGWGIAFSANGTTVTGLCVIPNGTVIPARGHFLVTGNPNVAATPTYSLTNHPGVAARTADGDTGYVLDLADNGGFAIFKTSIVANFNAGTRMDSVGFAGIAAGLFKEGAGIPNITAAAPAGQIAFHRVMTSGVPVDTGANENDFNFVDTNLEVLTATPKVGAPGPENLDGPVHSTSAATVDVAVFDNGAAANIAPNLFRDVTPGPVATSTFGTITFRRKITNNTGGPLPRLRYRVVDITTNPVAAAGTADLRVLTQAPDPAVPLFGGGTAAADGTTLETPPAQAAGGGFNSSLSIPGITLAAPLGAGASTNIAFTAGVQVRGAYNLCLVPEGVPEAAGGPLCFTGTTGQLSIIPGAPVARNTGDAGTSATIATVNSVEFAPGSLTVTVLSAPAGISITGITNTSGTVTATVAADCTAVAGANNVTLQVTDGAGATATATFVVNVTVIPTVPSISGATSTCTGVPVILTATSTSAASYQWYRDSGLLVGENASTISTAIAGSYTVTATSAGGCTTAQSAAHVLTVNPIPATPTATNTGPYCDSGSGVTIQLNTPTVAGATYAWTGPNSFASTLQNPTRPGATAADAGSYSVTVTVDGCTSAPGSTTVVINPTPATPTATNGGPYCDTGSGVTVQLNTPTVAGATYSWTGPTGFTSALQNPTRPGATPSDAGTYSVTVTVNGCTSAAGTTNVIITSTPATPTATNGGPYCEGQTIQLNTPTVPGATYSWTGPGGFASALQNPTRANAQLVDAGSYSVTVTVGGCTSAAGSTTVVVNATPATPTATNGGPYCSGATIQLNTPT
ncbi:MAG TPA: hypothetical protein VKB93_18210, partial [Thermoanaerobaculia bacterium]|nr:hypothetical protein [Thermoanaerobaculia bacterium]